MKFARLFGGHLRVKSLSIMISLLVLFQAFLVLSHSNAIDLYPNNRSGEDTECKSPILTSTAGTQNMTSRKILLYDKLIQKDLDVSAVDLNSKENIVFILAHGRENGKDSDRNLVLMTDTKLKKVNTIMINDNNLDLDKIQFDKMDSKLYLTGMKLTKINDKLVENDVLYLISLPSEKQETLFNDRYAHNSTTLSQNNDEIGIVDIDVGTKSGNLYVVLNERENIDNTQYDTSVSQYQLLHRSHISRDNKSQIYIIPFGNKIINSPDQKVNYVLLNGIKSYDKDVIFVLNETTGSIIKNYSLPSLNSRELALDSKNGKLYVLGDSFAYDDNIKGFSKQCEIITSIDTVSNNLTTLSLGDFVVKDFIKNSKTDAFYVIGKNHMLNSQQKSNDDYLLELDARSGTARSIVSIPLNLNYIIMNDNSNTLFVIARDLHQDLNVLAVMDLNRK